MVRLFLVSACVLLAAIPVALARGGGRSAARHPALRLAATAPVTVRGAHFRAHERVRLVLHSTGGTARHRARAGAHGRFRRAFTGVTIDRCSGFRVRATGAAGSEATLVRRAPPECAPE